MMTIECKNGIEQKNYNGLGDYNKMKISHIKTKIRTIYKGLINKSPCKKCLLQVMCSDLCPSKIYYDGVKLQY